MSELKPGYYVTRDGRKARVTCTDAPGVLCLFGYIVTDTIMSPTKWDIRGRVFACRDCNDDIIGTWREDQSLSMQDLLKKAAHKTQQNRRRSVRDGSHLKWFLNGLIDNKDKE